MRSRAERRNRGRRVNEGRRTKGRYERTTWEVVVFLLGGLVIATPVAILIERRATDAGLTVAMQRTAFSPQVIKVSKGTVVAFDNRDLAPHTVTADDGSFDSGIVGPGTEFRLRVERSVAFHCDVHPQMRAQIRVRG